MWAGSTLAEDDRNPRPMTLNLTIVATVDVGADVNAMSPAEREQWAAEAAHKAHDRVSDWFRGHPAKITAKAELWPAKQGS